MSKEKKLSVSDFKNWLEGVLDFQEEGWTPNLDQWNKILEKVEELDDTPPAPAVTNTSEPPPPQNVKPHMQPSTRHPRPQMDKSVLPPDLDEPTVSLPEAPVIKGRTSLQVLQDSSPSIINENGTKVINTGKTYKTKENQEPSAIYDSDFI